MGAKRLGAGLALVLAIALAGYLLAQLLPVGFDYYHWYWPLPRLWLAGQTRLYDEASRQFFSPPWALWMLTPLALLDIRWGMAGLTLVSAAIVGSIAYAVAREAGAARPWLIALLATVCPYSLELLFVGTLDAWSLLGIYLGYLAIRRRSPWLLGAGLLLTPIRPQDAVITLPALLLGSRGWPARRLARAAALPGGVFLASLLTFGWDWPLRWWQSYVAQPPHPYLVTSTYGAMQVIGVPAAAMVAVSLILSGLVFARVWRQGLSLQRLGLAVTANAIVSPYMLSQSYVVLLAIPWAWLAARRPWLAAIPYAISLPLLIRAQGLWDRLGLLAVTFPMVLLVLLLVETRRAQGRLEGLAASAGGPGGLRINL
ncbi:MAG: DUF2029 domain-containing protein [Chloroflexi bacterium]|nr:DUF2029 domain-containing protein [Chloroflexota bacterium]